MTVLRPATLGTAPAVTNEACAQLPLFVRTYATLRIAVLALLDLPGPSEQTAHRTEGILDALDALDRAGIPLPILDVSLAGLYPPTADPAGSTRSTELAGELVGELAEELGTVLDGLRRRRTGLPAADRLIAVALDTFDFPGLSPRPASDRLGMVTYGLSADGGIYLEVDDQELGEFAAGSIPADFIDAWAASHLG